MFMLTRKEFTELMVSVGDDQTAVNNLCAGRINDFWASRGKLVNARVETRPVFNGRSYLALPIIVTDTANGLPR